MRPSADGRGELRRDLADGSPSIGDHASRLLAGQLREASNEVSEPQRSRIVDGLPDTLFISHSSVDDQFIKGRREEGSPAPGSILWVCGEIFHDPFYHSFRTGGAVAYARLVGLALLSSQRVLAVWSEGALKSDYVRAELLLAAETKQAIVAFMTPGAPPFPLSGVTLVHEMDDLRRFLYAWRSADGCPPVR